MSISKPLLIIGLLVLTSLQVFSQCPFDTKFGKIKKEDFSYKTPFVDSNASAGALILFDIGNSELESDNAGGMRQVFTKHTRIKILNKSGFDVATVKNVLLKLNKELQEEIENLKASTFNIEDNVIKEYKLDKKSMASTKIVEGYYEDIFTLPSVKEGSIIEYSYTIRSDFFFNYHQWYFQGFNPIVYSEYTVLVPEFLKYNFDIKPFVELNVTKKKTNNLLIFSSNAVNMYGGFDRPQVVRWNGDAEETKWIGNNIPSVNNEPFLNSPSNYFTNVKFKLIEIDLPSIGFQRISLSWSDIDKRLKRSTRFGEEVFGNNLWLYKDAIKLAENEKDTLKIIKNIYEFVRDNFKSIDNNGIYIRYEKTLRDVFKNKEGSPTELNLLFVAILKQLKIEANPLIVSTKHNGFVNQTYPSIDEYNYLVSKVRFNNKDYYFDVSKTKLGFNKLPLDCYNENGRLIGNFYSSDCILTSDSLQENEKMFVYISNDENGISTANCKETYSYYQSLNFRTENNNKTIKEISESKEKEFQGINKLKDISIDSLKQYDYPVCLNYFIDYKFTEDVVYFNPMMNQAITENPFKSATRKFPVERPYAYQLNYSFNMEVPKGYKLDELPKSSKILLNEDEGMFEYKISIDENLIQLKCKLKFNKAIYPAEDYQTIRDFYGLIVKKMSEQIVFKKNK